jgi:N utilization substance protein A
MAVSANRLELLQIADAVAREKSIDRGIVIGAMEEAIAKAARSRYGAETDVHANIDSKTGELRLSRHMLVVEAVENPSIHIGLDEAKKRNPAAQVGDTIADTLPPLEYGRIAAGPAKLLIVPMGRAAYRDRQFIEYKDRIGDIINGIVKRVEYGNVVVDLGRGEAIVRRDEMLPRETLRNGDRVRAYIYDVRREPRGPQIFLSRTHPQFMAKLFAQEVPEIYDGIVEVKAVARDPGSRAKIAVISRDSSVDPVGACVGMKGSRVQAVVQELQGEKIDIIPWSEDTATFVVNALQPATVSRVVLDEEESRIEVVVPDDQLSLAIGRRGQNVRLASQLTESQIDIMTEEEASEKRQREFAERSKMFEEELDVDETLSQLLVAEGFAELEEVAYVALEELAGIEGFDEELAQELQSRAREALDRQEEAHRAERRALGVEDALAEIPHLNEQMLVVLGKAGIKTLDDLADLATDELIAKKREAPRRRNPETGPPLRRNQRTEDKGGVLGEFGLSEEQGNEIIMAARAHWFEDEEAPVSAPVAEEAADAESSQ